MNKLSSMISLMIFFGFSFLSSAEPPTETTPLMDEDTMCTICDLPLTKARTVCCCMWVVEPPHKGYGCTHKICFECFEKLKKGSAIAPCPFCRNEYFCISKFSEQMLPSALEMGMGASDDEIQAHCIGCPGRKCKEKRCVNCLLQCSKCGRDFQEDFCFCDRSDRLQCLTTVARWFFCTIVFGAVTAACIVSSSSSS